MAVAGGTELSSTTHYRAPPHAGRAVLERLGDVLVMPRYQGDLGGWSGHVNLGVAWVTVLFWGSRGVMSVREGDHPF